MRAPGAVSHIPEPNLLLWSPHTKVAGPRLSQTRNFNFFKVGNTSGKHNCGINIIVESLSREIINAGINTVGFQIETAS